MLAEKWQRLRAAFHAVTEAPPSDRQRLIDEISGSQPDLADELLQLLDAEASPDQSLERPIVHLLPPRLEPGTVLAGRFRLVRPIGRGGMGDVWAARDETLHEDVAVKTLRDVRRDPQRVRRFMRETQLARRISHSNVCRVNDFFEDTSVVPPRAFLTMALLEGETLAARLQRSGPLSCDESLAILRQLLAGLDAAHSAGVVHRDLKPANVMLSAADDGPRAVIMDFGLARDPDRLETESMTTPGLLVGTPEYMAPEQISGAPVTPATDFYALGLILFEMLRGSKPNSGGSTLESWMRRARESPPALSGVVPGVDGRIDEVIRRCLAYSPSERYQSAGEILRALGGSRLVIRLPRTRRAWATIAVVLALLAAAVWTVSRPRLPSAEALQWLDDARVALAEGAAVRALSGATRAINLAPWFAPAHAALAEIRLELDMPSRAQEAMLRAGELSPARLPQEYAEYVQGLQALVLHECGRAVEALRRVALTSPVERRAYRLVSTARAMERCDQPDAATALMKEAAVVDPRNAAVPLRVARIAATRREYPQATAALDTAERLFRDRNNVEGRGEVLVLRGTLQVEQDLLAEAEATLSSASDIARSLGDVRQQVRIGIQRSILARKRGNVVEAARLTESMLELARQNDLETLAVEGVFAAGNAHVIRSEFSEAQALFERALAIAETYRHDGHRARAWVSLATVFVPTGQNDRALSALATARPYYERTRQVRLLASTDVLAGQVQLARAEYAQAVRTFTAARDEAQDAKDVEQETRAIENLATARGRLAEYAEALALYRTLDERFRLLKQHRRELLARLNAVDIVSRMGRIADARRDLADIRRDATADLQLESRIARVEAGVALYAGEYTVAHAASVAVLESRESVPPERRTRARLMACEAAAHLGRHREAGTYCGAALAASDAGDRALRTEAHLVAAAAKWLAGDMGAARTLLADLSTQFATAETTEDRWRFLALSALTGDASMPGASSRDQLTRELEGLRLKWGEGDFGTWRTRADVATLLRPIKAQTP